MQRKDCCEEKSPSALKTYFPLLLILFYLVGGTLLFEWEAGSFDGMRWMRHFMGGFFLIFSFFKFLNLKGFVEAYRTYDLVAQKVPLYGWLYPFIELKLGILYVIRTSPQISQMTDVGTLIVMSVSALGVARSLLRKSQIQCACLGTVFQLPMTKVTLFEDLLMAVMALVALIQQ